MYIDKMLAPTFGDDRERHKHKPSLEDIQHDAADW
jgi:hypothetical protein